MIVRIATNKGEVIGRPMDDLQGQDLLEFIEGAMETGRIVVIIPEDKDVFPGSVYYER